jgi:glycosyltransferase involved in cell wall biosynthesis
MIIKDLNILIISHEEWGEVWYSKHHYAYYLSKNNTVFFINPPSSFNPLKKLSCENISDSLIQINYHNFLPFPGRSQFVNKIHDWLVSRKINRFLNKQNQKDTVLWSFDPQRFIHPNFLNIFYSIYHCMDSYRMVRELRFVSKVNMVICVAAHFQNLFNGLNSKVILLPHAVQEREGSFKEICDYKDKNDFLLIGNVNYRFDFNILISIAEKYKYRILNIAGPIDKSNFNKDDHSKFDQLNNLKNVSFLGSKNYQQLILLIKKARICLATYKLDYDYSRYNSLKIMQYLNYGKCVVSSHFEAYDDEPELIWMTGDNSKFLELIDEALKEENISADSIKKRLTYSDMYSYTEIIKKIEVNI